MRRLAAATFVVALLSGASCGDDALAPARFLSEKLGGDTTAKALRGRAFNQSARNLTNGELRRFGAGADVFDQRFDATSGLGPIFNQTSCLGCHLDGKQQPHDRATPPGLLVRVSAPGVDEHGGPVPEPTYGLQLQTDAVDGSRAEATLSPRYVPVTHTWADGHTSTLYRLDPGVRPALGPMVPGAATSVRMAPSIIGLGLLEEIPEADLWGAADPRDANHDGVSGRVQQVWDRAMDRMVVGRFGWKAGQPSVARQTTVALHDDMGVTSSADMAPNGSPNASVPELGDGALDDMIFYNRTIAVPIAKNIAAPTTRRGAAVFQDIGCAACHTPTQHTGPSDLAALADQTFHPYTDLLLHDMGPGLADGRSEYRADGREWRTAPLWGKSRRVEVTGSGALLHDGRARTVTEAVLWHGGEASRSRIRFEQLSGDDRAALLAFLDTL